MRLHLDDEFLTEVNVVVWDFGIFRKGIPTHEDKSTFVGWEVEDEMLPHWESKTRYFKDNWRQLYIAPVVALNVNSFDQFFLLHISIL